MDSMSEIEGSARRRRWEQAGAALAVVAFAAAVTWSVVGLRPTPTINEVSAREAVARPATAPVERPPRRFAVASLTESDILDLHTASISVVSLAQNPRVLILTFPDFVEQGRMLNRIAAFTEKAGLPRDRILDDAALDAAILSSGATPATYYYAHDYRAADILRFFRIAERDGIVLNEAELSLKALLDEQGWTTTDMVGALISVPNSGADPVVDEVGRAALLRHELAPGEYFTDPKFAAAAWDWWNHRLTASERKEIRHFLASLDYDVDNGDLVVNEAQAYLIETPDARFFAPDDVNMTAERLDRLRSDFLTMMPPSWLRDATATPSP